MRTVPEWIADRDDQPVPTRVKLRVFYRSDGLCAKCGRRMRPGYWECDHIVALCNGGQHRESNLQPLCASPCHSAKTRADRKVKAKTDAVAKRHIGIRRPSRFRGWKNMRGEPVQNPNYRR